jgi:LacI family transcriptional regulator
MVTLKQLAKELNVSISTVSKALNDSDEIGEHTIKRVKELAKFYNYKPNKMALSLKSNKTNTVGVVIPNILNRFFAKVLFGIEKEATKLGYNIITCMSNELLTKEKQSLQLLANGSVDGFILSVAEETQIKNNIDHFNTAIGQGLPIVMFDRVASDIKCDKVIIDDIEAICNAAHALVDEGRKRIAFISSIDDLSVGKLREAGYHKALDEMVTNNEPLILKINDKEDPQQQIISFLKHNKKLDGIIAADNVSGVMAINIASYLGYKIPKDISVIGFADETISKLSMPQLTTINQNAEEIGKSAMRLLDKRLKNEEEFPEPLIKVIKTNITYRDSTINN